LRKNDHNFLWYRGFPENVAPTQARGLKHPQLSTNYVSGFAFSKCHAARTVPHDPMLQMIYSEDDVARFIR
jgi:hypothetical protein